MVDNNPNENKISTQETLHDQASNDEATAIVRQDSAGNKVTIEIKVSIDIGAAEPRGRIEFGGGGGNQGGSGNPGRSRNP